jgi:hypothetical protein
MITKVLQPSESHGQKSGKYGGHLLYQKCCGLEHSNDAKLLQVAYDLALKT